MSAETRADRIAADILAKLDAKANRTIYGPDGKPLFRPVVDDRTITYAKDGESYSLKPEELLIRAARMLRDGMSLERIRDELDLIKSGPQEVTLGMLERAIRTFGMPWLEAAIARGEEPAESRTVVGYEAIDDDPEPDATPAIVDSHG